MEYTANVITDKISLLPGQDLWKINGESEISYQFDACVSTTV